MSLSQLRVLFLALSCSLAFACGDSDGGGGDDGGVDSGGGGGGGGGTSGLACGTGTIEDNGECVPDPSTLLTCATGTFQFMGECVTVDPDDSTAPTTTAEPMGGRYLVLPAKVTLTTDEPATIYYTTDGSAPDTSSTSSPSPAVIAPVTDGMEIRFFAEDPAENAEDPQSETYEQAVVPPPPVSDVAVNMNGNDATLSWTTPSEADGVLIVQVGLGAVVSPTAGESYAADDMLGSGTVVFVGAADDFDVTDLPVGVTSWLIYTYNDVLQYSGGVLARSGEIVLPTQNGVLTVNVAGTSASVGTNPPDLTVTADNVTYDGIGATVSVDVTVENESGRSVFLPKLLVKDAALSGGGSAGLANSQGAYPNTKGIVTGTVDVTTLTLPGAVNPGVLNLYAGNGIQNLDFAAPAFTGTTPASLIQYINDNSTGLTASLNASNEVVITTMSPGSLRYTYVSNSGVGTTLGFDGISNYGTDLSFVYFCPADPEASDDAIIDDRAICMRALRPGESVTKTLVFSGVVSDSVVTVDFELRGNPLVVGGDAWTDYSSGNAVNTFLPLFDTRANQGVGFLVQDTLAAGPNGRLRTSAFVLSSNGNEVLVGSKVGMRLSVYDLRTARVVGGRELEAGRGYIASMRRASDGYLYVLLNLNQHEFRWPDSSRSLAPSEAVLLRLDPDTLEELARAHIVLHRPEYTAPATHTTSVAVSGLVFPAAVTGGTLVVSVNGAANQTVNFNSPMFTGATGAALATFINANSTGLNLTFDSALDRLVIETEANGKDESFQFTTTAAATTLGISTSLYEGDQTAEYYQNTSSEPPRAKWMDITDDGSMLAFGVVQEAESIQGVFLDTGSVYFVDLATMTFIDKDDGKDGVQPVYLDGAIDPADTALDEISVGPVHVAFSPDGSKLFATGDDQVDTDVYAVATIDVETGDVSFSNLQDVTTYSSEYTGKFLWRSPVGRLFLLTWNEYIEIDPADGSMTRINTAPTTGPGGYQRWPTVMIPGVGGNYFLKDYEHGVYEVAPDGTELYSTDYMCASSVGANTTSCSSDRSNYGKGLVATLY